MRSIGRSVRSVGSVCLKIFVRFVPHVSAPLRTKIREIRVQRNIRVIRAIRVQKKSRVQKIRVRFVFKTSHVSIEIQNSTLRHGYGAYDT